MSDLDNPAVMEYERDLGPYAHPSLLKEAGVKKPRPARFTWPPPKDLNKRFNNEVAGPAALLLALGLDIELTKENSETLLRWIGQRHSLIIGLLSADAGSWNHAHMLITARAASASIRDEGEIKNLLELQAGIYPPPMSKDQAGPAYYLEGEEPRSNDYNAMRIACYGYFAKRGSNATIRALANQVIARVMGLELLGAVPWNDKSEFRAGNGRMWYQGPTLSPVGQRSNKTSNPDQLGMFCRFMLGRADLVRPEREGWECAVIDRVGFEPILPIVVNGKSQFPQATERLPISSPADLWRNQAQVAIALLGNARTMTPFHFVMYPEGLLVWQPAQVNPNTPSALYSFADHRTEIMTRGFPFDPSAKGRGVGAPKSLGCTIDNGTIIARSEDARWTASMELPKSAPVWAVDIGPDGVKVVG